jgi:hypothetical protein
VSLAQYHTLSAAAVLVQLIALYRLAREGSPQRHAQAMVVAAYETGLVIPGSRTPR